MPQTVEQMALKHLHESDLARAQRTEAGHAVVNPVITISRSLGSGGRIVARKLAEDLGFSLWDGELIDAIAAESEMPPAVVEAFDEKTHSEIELLVYATLGRHDFSGFLYLRHLARIAAAIASVGNAIILGRGVNFLLPHALNIRMNASVKLRILNLMEFEGDSRETAEEKIHTSDRERERYLTDLFGKDRVRSFHYDVSLWMDKLTVDSAAEIVRAAYKGFYQSH